MCFGKILTARAFALVQIWNGVQPEAINAHPGPVIQNAHHSSPHQRTIEVQIRLMRKEPVPVIGLRDGVPTPVRRFKIFEDDSRAGVLVWAVAPYIEIAP